MVEQELFVGPESSDDYYDMVRGLEILVLHNYLIIKDILVEGNVPKVFEIPYLAGNSWLEIIGQEVTLDDLLVIRDVDFFIVSNSNLQERNEKMSVGDEDFLNKQVMITERHLGDPLVKIISMSRGIKEIL